MTEKHVFAGNNTSKGFFSYFDYLINPYAADRIYILKGGPGVGKSSFMKKIGESMWKKKHPVEYIHCSSDNDSLDGVIISDLKVIFVDGTAPHTIDPVLPGAVDEIVNLGIYLDNKDLQAHKDEIVQINKTKSQLYKSAYTYLKGAGLILDEINSIYDRYTDDQEFSVVCEEVLDKIFTDKSSTMGPGKVRKLFSEAYTANGYINHTDSLCEGNKVWAIVGENVNYASKLLDRILNEALRKGYFVEAFYMPLHPEKLQHLLIPELNLFLKTADSHIDSNYDEVINLHPFLDIDTIITFNSDIANNFLMFNMLVNNGLERLEKSKKEHEKLEAIYKNAMNFKGVDECYDKIMSQYI
ncbi:hypothetical protein EDD66_10338 [Mobilisporobacter senegalensis]|uniref:ATPase n=1 Tax=Mobilisporobacter senegalensis TaxID=1329262 RepID=A0A3N1XR06_9FIRM|nr:hypothetical protein [Mobilisporobacter senegalensis]ROR29103.1 hypothetical protein EDD66_10338 [Mobilisporobacter senegalensis]